MITCLMHKISVIDKEHNLSVFCKIKIHQDSAQTSASKYLAAYKIIHASGGTKKKSISLFNREAENLPLLYL